MSRKFSFFYMGKRLEVDLVKCNNFQKFLGLMLKSKGKANALLFDFKKPSKIKFHSLFVFFQFYILMLDDKNSVIEMKKIKPFTINIFPKKKYARILEIPINKKYSRIIKYLSKN